MNNKVVFNQVLKVILTSLFTEYALQKYKRDEYMTLQSNLLESRNKLLDFVKKGNYGKLDIRVDWPNSLDKISVENTDCSQFDEFMVCFVHFDFKSESPTLNYVYKDSTLKLSLPDSFELEQ